MLRHSTVLALACFGALGCSIVPQTHTAAYSYEFSDNGCDTGKHSFSSVADMCLSLKDDAANNGCAAQMRSDEYQARNCAAGF